MDLIEYLSSKKDREGKPIIKKRKRGRRKVGRPRRARGYGQRSSKYNGTNQSSFDNNVDMKLSAILAAITRIQTPTVDLSNPLALNPFVERDRQIYSMKKPDKQTLDTKSITLQTQTELSPPIDKVQKSIKDVEKQKGIIFNYTQDLDSKIAEILDKQEDLKVAISMKVDYGEGEELGERSGKESNLPLSYEAAKHLRQENLKLKEEVLSETYKVQKMLNDAEDLNDYRDLLQKQNKLIDLTTKGFVKIDNYIDNENKRTFDEVVEKHNEKLEENIKTFTEEAYKLGQEDAKEQQGAITKKLGQEIFMKKRLKTYEKETGGLIQGISKAKIEKQGILGQEILGNVRDRIQQEKISQGAIRAIEGQGDIIREQSSQLREISEFNRELQEDKQIGILGVLGQEALGNVKQRVANIKINKQKKKAEKVSQSQEMELIDMRGQALTDLESKGKMVQNIKDLRNIVKEQQTTGRLQGIREGALAGVRERLYDDSKKNKQIRKGLGQEILIKKRKDFIDIMKSDNEDLTTLLEREEEASEIREDYMRQMEEDFDLEKATIRKGLGREIVGRKKQQTQDTKKEQKIEKMSGLLKEEMTEKMKFMVKAKEALEKAEKEAAKRDITKQQLEGMKGYIDKLNDELLSSGSKGAVAQQQYYQKEIQYRDTINEELKLKLERSERNEIKLKNELTDLEGFIDIEAEMELQRVLSET